MTRWSLVLVAVLAVGREGLETALFLWAATQAGTRDAAGAAASTWEPLLGAALGLATAVVLGYLIYRGAISINLSRFFAWTGGFLILVAAGVLSYGVHDLQEAGILPGQGSIAFDVSGAVDPGTWYAALLKGVFNFSPVTTHLEAAAWLLYAVPTMTLSSSASAAARPDPGPPGSSSPGPRLPRADPAPAPDRTNREGLPPHASSPARGRPGRGPGTRRLHPEHHRGPASEDHRTVTVSSTDDGCELSSTEAPSGKLTFDVTNDGSTVTEFYLYTEDASGSSARSRTSARISPGAGRQRPARHLRDGVQARHEGRRHPRRLHRHPTPARRSTPRPATQQMVEHAQDEYGEFVQHRVRPAPRRHPRVRGGVHVGERRLARKLYPEVRTHWERIETGRGVLRGPRPEDGRPRGRPRVGARLDRLAPDREGPVAGPRDRNSTPRSPRGSGRVLRPGHAQETTAAVRWESGSDSALTASASRLTCAVDSSS